MSEPSNQASSAPALQGISDQEIFALMERAKTDPAAARQVAIMQKQCDAMVTESIRKIAALFVENQAVPASSANPSADINVRVLAAHSRSQAAAGKERLELAEQYVIGRLVNYYNPDWDPLDPATSREVRKSALLALLEFREPHKGD